MTLYFPDEIDEHGTFAEIGDIVDEVVPHDEHVDEMLTMRLSQIEEITQPELTSPFDLFGGVCHRGCQGDPNYPYSGDCWDVIAIDGSVDGLVSLVEGASDFVDPPISFDYFSVSHVIALFAPSSPTSQISDIDDEIAQHDSNDDSSPTSHLDPSDQRVSPAIGDTKIVDFATVDQPRELRIKLDLSTDERFLLVVEYPEWLANVVPIPKKDGKVRVFVDFRDLNKASPKDDFPLPHIDMLVDSIAGHSMLSFMDEFSGYNQILMALEDMEKTSFIIEWGSGQVLERIQQFKLRLNPKKGTFGVTSRKLLGYMVSERGIKVDPDKIRAILDMPASRTKREVRGFLGRLQYIRRFIVS
ncbi:Transposon Ty3-G Gag-Pol polyprotein [Vitis vinifera]|uniref:Transposon Ty3-G Gag-Pol polyprotein n=1 Tax=Vitis vinifera TaxID=29760 RepID=A0A438HGF0_VITVI|nr:Transposon Ty3-G Gag-Pol polyprotein [Vitis vinifera]